MQKPQGGALAVGQYLSTPPWGFAVFVVSRSRAVGPWLVRLKACLVEGVKVLFRQTLSGL